MEISCQWTFLNVPIAREPAVLDERRHPRKQRRWQVAIVELRRAAYSRGALCLGLYAGLVWLGLCCTGD